MEPENESKNFFDRVLTSTSNRLQIIAAMVTMATAILFGVYKVIDFMKSLKVHGPDENRMSKR